MLKRVIYISRTAASGGLSTLGLAQILGQAERNNRRDGLYACLMTHGRHLIHVIEGRPADVDRLMARLRVDPRHRDLTVLTDKPVTAGALEEPMSLCGDMVELIARLREESLGEELQQWLAVDAA